MAKRFSTVFFSAPNRFSRHGFLALLLAVVVFFPKNVRSEEISFTENYTESLTDEGSGLAVTGVGNSMVRISLLWEGTDISLFDSGTEINFSIGDFQFNHVLSEAPDYEDGFTTATFVEIDTDGQGVEYTNSYFTVSWTDKTFTIAGIIRNRPGGAFENYFGAKNYLVEPGPINELFNASITFDTYSKSFPVAVTGRTTQRTVFNPETQTDETLNRVDLSGDTDLPPPDTTAPKVTIISPVANGRLLTQQITGTASDNRSVAEVLYQLNGGDFIVATGTSNWLADVALEPGTNTVRVKSVDTSGNVSPILTRNFSYIITSPLTVNVFDEPSWGSTTLTNGQPMEVNRNYSITAKPAAAYVFLEWLGSVNSTNPTLTFVMASNFVLEAYFAPNPFVPIAGIYNGLFSNTNGVTPDNAGFLTLTLRSSGLFSGQVLLGGARHPLSGKFDLAGRANPTVDRRGKPPLLINLQLEFNGSMRGTIEQEDGVSTLVAEQAQTTVNSAKKYTLLVPPSQDPATTPGGYGFGSASVDLKNKIKFTGVLSDGVRVSQVATLSASGRWPLFVSLYRGKGVLLGWIIFTNEPDSDLFGETLSWVKAPGVVGKYYSNGFTLSGSVFGSEYRLPPFISNWTSLIEFNGGNLSSEFSEEVEVGPHNTFTISSLNKTALSIKVSTGLVRGKFINPATRKNALLKGALLQKQQVVAGFFQGTNQTGSFLLRPTVP